MNQSSKLLNLIYAGVFAAILAVLSQLAIPMPSSVPMTLQTFGVAFCAYLLGTKRGLTAYLIYFLLGTAGVPVFANFTGGPGKIFGLTGGFLSGFFLLTLFCGMACMIRRKTFLSHTAFVALGFAGLLLCHLAGILQFSFLSKTGFPESFLLVSLPYLPKDLVCTALAYLLSGPARKLLKLS